MNTGAKERNVSDAELVRYLDDEVDDAERVALHARIAAEPASAARLETLRARSADLASWLAAIDPTDDEIARVAGVIGPRIAAPSQVSRPPARAATRPAVWIAVIPPLLRAAVIVLLLATAAVAVPPLRTHLADVIERVTTALGIAARQEPASPISEDLGSDIRVTIAASSHTFRVEIEGFPAGRLVLRRTADARVTADVRGGPQTSLLVLTDGLRIGAAGETEAVFTIELPDHVNIVRVRIAGGEDVAYPLPDPGDTRVIELRAR